MIRHEVEQGSGEWSMLRLGIPTASSFDRILTPGTLKVSKQAAAYRNQLLAEWLLGYPIDWSRGAFGSGSMDRGKRMEEEARLWYEMELECDIEPGGFILRDDELVGGSPDGLVGDEGGVELKCPEIHTHIGYMLEPANLEKEYLAQVQGYLYLTGRLWWDVVSYHPDLPKVIRRVQRNSEFIVALDQALAEFVASLELARAQLEPHKLAAA